MTRRTAATVAKKDPTPGEVPHSWFMNNWPGGVAPGSVMAAKTLFRFHKNELIAAKAVVRIGRRIVVMGREYDAWLRSHAEQVKAFIPPGIGADPT